MARRYRPVVRDQEFLLPPNMADWLPEDHLVWFVIGVVDQLDTARFHARRRRGTVGRQGYDPDMLLALLLYAYATGERSSRRIERLCVDHVAFRVLCGQDPPDHTTLARFRAEHEDSFADVFTQLLTLCAAAGMVRVRVVSIDGTKIAADAARASNRTPEAVREEARRIAEEVVAQAAANDAAEAAEAAEAAAETAAKRDGSGRSGGSGDLPEGFASHSGRAANIKKALDELERQQAAEVAVDAGDRARVRALIAELEAGAGRQGPPPAGVDPVAWHQAKIAGAQRLLDQIAGLPGHQAAKKRKDLKARMARAVRALTLAERAAAAGEIDPRGIAARRRDRRDRTARERGGMGRRVNRTDPDSRLMTEGSGGGSVQGYNAQFAVSDDHLVVGIHLSQDANDTGCYLPTLADATTNLARLDLEIGTVLADAGYCTVENLTAPGPGRLIATGKNHEITQAADQDPATGPPPVDATPVEVMAHRLREPDNTTAYKRRSATVEPVFAHLKEQTKLRRFARRGLTATTAELHLTATALNLTKLHKATLSPA